MSSSSAAPPPLSRRPVFWLALVLVAAGSVAFSVRSFSEAFPVANVELEMDRAGALAAARALADAQGWGPAGFRQAASFSDPAPEVRVYLELELGEDDAIGRLADAGGYHPYRWQVRHFREGEARELLVRFTPAGDPYGFRLTLPEDEPGAALPAAEARSLAEAGVTADWNLDLAPYELVESSQETRPSGRTDHTFVYERAGAALGEADVRLRLRVSGDELSELSHTVRIPEAFLLRYAEVRTANTRLALGASLLFLALFLVVGCGGGIFYLVRTRGLEWRAPLAWGGVVAFALALAALNDLPRAWMDYDTALSSSAFLLQAFFGAGIVFAAAAVFLAVIFMAAESLGRRAFPNHPQQWRLWHPEVARSAPAIGRTVGGYAVAALGIGFVVAFYLWAGRREGWWMPSEALVEPDLLASYLPWLSAVSLALFSGFWEESLFRAIPIAGAALIGARYGGRRWWILAALLLQAAVFAAAHADYPQQPAYARLAELFLPALFWGVLYIWFGLVPVILAHASYNLTLLSIPIWAASAPGIWLDRAAIVLIGLIPLWIVLWHVGRRGYRPDLPAWASNAAWRPPEEAEPTAVSTAPRASAESSVGSGPPAPPDRRRLRPLLVGCALAGIALLAVGLRLTPEVPPLEIDRAEAESLARAVLTERGITLGEEWRAIASPVSGATPAHRFVREEGGREVYLGLLGGYLRGVGWRVRFARFSGPVEERAEAFEVLLGGDGALRGFSRRLPEARPGASLEEDEARSLAGTLLQRELGHSPGSVEEISAVATQHPDRRDWTFTWSDRGAYPLDRGDARMSVGLAGDALGSWTRFVHVPEEWEREQEGRRAGLGLLNGLSMFLLVLLVGASAVAGLVRWARTGIDRRAAAWGAGVGFACLFIPVLNATPTAGARFSSTQGFGEQLLVSLTTTAFGYVLVGGAFGLVAGLVHDWLREARVRWGSPRDGVGRPHPAAVGAALGLFAAGLSRAAVTLGPRDAPSLPFLHGAGSYLPPLTPAVMPGIRLLAFGLLVLLAITALDWFTEGWSRRKPLALFGLLGLGFATPGPTIADAVWGWLLVGLAIAGGYYALYRIARIVGPAFVPWLVFATAAVAMVSAIVHPAYAGAASGALLGLLLIGVLTYAWSRYLEGIEAPGARPSPKPEAPVMQAEAP